MKFKSKKILTEVVRSVKIKIYLTKSERCSILEL